MHNRFPLLAAAAALTAWALPAAAQPASDKDATAETAAPAEQAEAATTPDEAGAAPSSSVTSATVEEVRAGSPVFDTQGGEVGTVESVDENGAVVSTGSARDRRPDAAFRSSRRNGFAGHPAKRTYCRRKRP